MNFRDFVETWDAVGTGATREDEQYAEKVLLVRLREMVKDPYARYKENRLYLGEVGTFFPKVPRALAGYPVFWNPKLHAFAQFHRGNRSIDVGVRAFKYRQPKLHVRKDLYVQSPGLGSSFLHEVEHLYDEVSNKTNAGSEFTPRLRQMLRQLRDEPGMRVWNYFHPKHGYWHAAEYVDRHLGDMHVYNQDQQVTPQEREFAIQAVQRRAKEIFARMEANGEFGWSTRSPGTPGTAP